MPDGSSRRHLDFPGQELALPGVISHPTFNVEGKRLAVVLLHR